MNLIVAVSADWGIGYKNKLLYRIPEDLQRFKEITLTKTVVMGRRTYESLPKTRRPLPNRENIVLSRDKSLKIPGVLTVHSEEALLKHLESRNSRDIFVIGGAEIYARLLKYCRQAYLTKVDSSPQADVYMPNMDKMPNWKIVWESCTKIHGDTSYKYVIMHNAQFSPIKSIDI